MRKKWLGCIVSLLLAASAEAQQTDEVRTVFQQPNDVKLGTFWYWISNNISEEGATEDIRAMKRVGVNLAFLSNIGGSTWWKDMNIGGTKLSNNYPVGSIKFMSDDWWRVVHTALKTASEEGVDLGLFNCAGWSQSGGTWIEPQQSMKVLVATEAHVSIPSLPVPSKKKENSIHTIRIPKPAELSQEQTREMILNMSGSGEVHPACLDYFEDVRVVAFPVADSAARDTMFVPRTFSNLVKQGTAVINGKILERHKGICIDPSTIIDLTDKMQTDGTVDISLLSPNKQWRILRMGMTTTGTFNSPTVDEARGLEVDKMNHHYLRHHFDSYIGEVLRRIPAENRRCLKYVVLDSYEKGGQNFTQGMVEKFSERYHCDMWQWLPTYFGYTVGNKELSSNFLTQVRRYIADEIATEYVGAFRNLAHEHGLRTWLENYGHGGFSGEALSYGKLSDEVAGEFWLTGHTDEKRVAASCAHLYGKPLAWAESFTSDPRAHGKTYTRNPQNLKTCADLAFTQGINATILHVYIQQYLNDDYPGVDGWFGTELNRKNTYWSHMDLFTQYLKRCGWMLRQGRSVNDIAYYYGDNVPMMHPRRMPAPPKGFDFDDVNTDILMHHLFVREGKLVTPSGCEYRALVLRDNQAEHDSVRTKIEELRRQGAIIIKGGTTEELAAALGSPDCHITGGVKIEYCHRTLTDGREIYFLSNQKDSLQRFEAEFRVSGLVPEWWNPVTGEILPISNWKNTENGTIVVSMKLYPNESAFIVFGRTEPMPSTYVHLAEQYELPASVTPWTVTFQNDSIHRGPSAAVTLTALADLSKSSNDSIRYYSGTATYFTTLRLKKLPKDQPLYLDIGNVQQMAKVWLNGQYVGGAWTAPYRLPLPVGILHKGNNDLRIEVVGTWWNRLVGDSHQPETKQRLSTYTNQASPKSSLQSYGLIGPVQIISYR